MTDPFEQLRNALADRYEIERELGRGGMATVYLARDLRHDRPVALKLLHPELAASMGDDRFQREIRLAARLQHPHILTVYDSGQSAGRLWFIMPYVEGESLRARLARERQLPVEDAIRIAREAAQALQYAHEHDVVHRDIKPNVGGDVERALAIAEAGLRIVPNNADLLATAAAQEQTLGRFEKAVARLERGFAVDPRSPLISRRLGYALMVLRRYTDANVAFERGLTLSPENYGIRQNMALAALGQGDIEAVRRMGEGVTAVDRDQLLAYLSQFEELGWALDRSQQDRVLELEPALFDNDRGAWALVRAQLYWLRGDRPKSRNWADTARIEFAAQLREAPDDAQRLVIHGVALAYLGRYSEAIRDGKRATELLPSSRDAYFGPYIEHQLVRIYLLAGDHERALDHLESLLATPYTLTPAWLRIDPMFDPVRKHPRFLELVEGTA